MFNIKKMEETRNEKLDELDKLLKTAQEENRGFTEEEKTQFDAIEKAARELAETIAAAKRRNQEEATQTEETSGQEDDEKKEKNKAAQEERAFSDYIRGVVGENRSAANMTVGDNGAVIPTTIANKIIEMVKELSPIVKLADRYNVAGNLVIPAYDETTQKITVAYADEFVDLESSAGKFVTIELKDFLAGALTKVSRSLINKTNFNLTSYVTKKMAEAIAAFLEKEMLYGTGEKITGMEKGVKQVVTTAANNKITADELIDLQDMVPDAFQGKAIWIMSRKTRSAIRKLKDNDGNYLLNKDVTAKWGYTLLGKDVYTSDNMKEIGAGNTAVFYGDMSGMALKMGENMNIQVLREKFATQHAVGVVGWIAADAKVEHTQKISALKLHA